MKFGLTFLLLCIAKLSMFCQLMEGYHYKLGKKQPINIYFKTDSLKPNPKIDQRLPMCAISIKASLIQSGSILIVDFAPWLSADQNYNTVCFGLQTKSNPGSYFYIPLDAPEIVMAENGFINLKYSGWDFGLITIPIKYRYKLQNSINNVQSNLNLGMYFGRKIGKTRFHYNSKQTTNYWATTLGGFFAPSSVRITPENTSNKITTSYDSFFMSYGFTLMFSKKNLSIGMQIGTDRSFSDPSKKWDYNKKTWIGLGYHLGWVGHK
jgi:hypothetical protein